MQFYPFLYVIYFIFCSPWQDNTIWTVKTAFCDYILWYVAFYFPLWKSLLCKIFSYILIFALSYTRVHQQALFTEFQENSFEILYECSSLPTWIFLRHLNCFLDCIYIIMFELYQSQSGFGYMKLSRLVFPKLD